MIEKKLIEAIKSGNIFDLETILNQHHALIDKLILRKTLLNHAAKLNNVKAVEFLLSMGADIDSQYHDCETPLYTAARYDCYEAAKFLLEKGASVNGKENYSPPIFGAIGCNSERVVRLILEYKPVLNKEWGQVGYTPLSYSQSYGERNKSITDILSDYLSVTSLKQEKNDSLNQYLKSNFGKFDVLNFKKLSSSHGVSLRKIEVDSENPFTVIVTSGLSQFSMPVPDESLPKKAELLMYLPSNWPLDLESLNKEVYSWPIEWLLIIANDLISTGSWIGWPSATYSNGEPPKPLNSFTSLSSWLLLADESENGTFNDSNGDKVQVYELYPLHSDELSLVRKYGVTELLDLFNKYHVDQRINPNRKSALPINY